MEPTGGRSPEGRGRSAQRSAPPGALGVETLIALRRAHDHIDRHYSEPLDLAEVARAAGYSRHHFVRAFRTAYGETPGRYLSRRRIERAQELLRSPVPTVTEVCHAVGFTSLGSFSSRFRDVTGLSPTEFQRRAATAAPLMVPGCYLLRCAGPLPQAMTATRKKPPEPAPL
ncbi:AraC-like DNA-binding protein [Spinactinospora alkalitolerans]|uniref:AraC-like DNA-binding protein n=1 Tax=Spinactinospora alkalitolerans TaxID=687207 RepID=A0A852TP37_9ACTN|nr:AraC family transcriptional regulator [Spinactinospora alkalitolerans]NYE45057.1 AraC-like DNA-binding protein [Spinactinospora alkalitolerans]